MDGFDVIPLRAGVGGLLRSAAGADALARLSAGLYGPRAEADRALCALAPYAREPTVRRLLGDWAGERLRANRELSDRCTWLGQLCYVAIEDSEVCYADGYDGPLHLIAGSEASAACGARTHTWMLSEPGSWRRHPGRRCADCAGSGALAQLALLEREDQWPPELRFESLVKDALRDGARVLELPVGGSAQDLYEQAERALIGLCVRRLAARLADDSSARHRALEEQSLAPAAWLALPGAPWTNWVAGLLDLADGPVNRWSAVRERAADRLGQSARSWWDGLRGTSTSSTPARECCAPIVESWVWNAPCCWCGHFRPRVNLPTGGVRTFADAAALAYALA